jgi:hypothetical protein
MVCEHKFVHVYIRGVANVLPDKNFIPRIVTLTKHDECSWIKFRVRPFLFYNQLHPRRKAVVKEQCKWGLTFDEPHPYAISEEKFQEEFSKYIEGYEHIEISGGEEATEYFRSFVKDKEIYNFPHQYYQCACRKDGSEDDFF